MSLQMRFHVPRGAYASRSWLHDVCSPHKATLAVHIRTPTKSGGRQPAVVGETRLQGDSLRVRRTNARRPRAAGVSPPWLEKRACRAIRFVFDERTYLDKSGGRQPAVLPKNVSATASEFRTATTFARCKQPHNHGGLTPPALVLVYGRPPAKNDFFDAQTHVRLKSGGCQPAVARKARFQRRDP